MTEKRGESEGKHEETASAERQDQAGWMWLFTLENVMLFYNRSLYDLDIQSMHVDRWLLAILELKSL